jgi:hypothetical protein
MTGTLRMRSTRVSMPVDEWAPPERLRWENAKLPGALLDDDGSRAAHSRRSNKEMEKGWGRWKAWDAAQAD